MTKCLRCGKEIEPDAPADAVVCGNCADDCREEEAAIQAEVEASASEDIAFEMDKEAYEDAQRERQAELERSR